MLKLDTSNNWQQRADTPPLPEGETTPLDWNGRLSIDMIRQHTKTDDIPGVTDEQLGLYRAAAVGAAERYTGMLLFEQKIVQEPVEVPLPKSYNSFMAGWNNIKPFYKYKLQHPVADGVVYLYGGMHPGDNFRFVVPPNTRTIKVPVRYGAIDMSNCCDPCAKPWGLNHGMMAMYKAGFRCADDIPAGIVLGCLQYIAWTMSHPGDEILTVRNRRDARSEGAQGTNNIAIASGALESWRIYDDSVV